MIAAVLLFIYAVAIAVAVVAEALQIKSPSYSHYHPRYHTTSFQLALQPQQLGEFEILELTTDERNQRRVRLHDLITSTNDEQIPYHEAWDMQKELVEQQLTRIGKRPKDPPLYDQFLPHDLEDNRVGCDSIIILQHDPVYTLGTASDPAFIHENNDENNDNNKVPKVPIVRIERGGEVTYHGPGQLTVYPILDLRGYKQDVHWYMRALEEVILLALEKAGVQGVSKFIYMTLCLSTIYIFLTIIF